MHGELEILDVIPRKEGLELLGAAYSGMSDVIKGTQFDPAIPQDARIAENFLKPVNLFGARYSHYPCVGGVYAVFRLIKDDSEDIPTFEELGYMPQQIQTIRRMLQRPEGIIVLSGPTGSGKSTTLRTASEAYLSTFGFNHNDNMRLPENAFSPLNHRRRAAFPAQYRRQSGIPSMAGLTRLNPLCDLIQTRY